MFFEETVKGERMTAAMAKQDQKRPQSPPVPHREDPILTPGEVAAMFGVVAQTVRNWIHNRDIEYIRMPGGRFGVRKSAVVAILVATGRRTKGDDEE